METSILSDIEWKVLKLIGEKRLSVSIKDIANYLGVSKGYVSKIVSRLEKKGLIKRITYSPASFTLTDLGESFLYNKGGVCRVDALRVWLGVSRVGSGVVSWLESSAFQKYDMRGWRKYRVRYDGNVFVEVNLSGLNPSVELVFDRLWVDSVSLIDGGFIANVFGYVWRVANWLSRYGLVVDLESMRITGHEFESFIPEKIAENLPEGAYSVDLGRPAVNLLGQPMKVNAKAWFDNSLGKKELGSNDFPYWYKFLMQPEILWDLRDAIYREFIPAIQTYTKQIQRHLEVLESMDLTLREIRRSFQERRPGLLQKIKSWFRWFLGMVDDKEV